MADRKVTVQVSLNATGNLAQATGAAAAQAAKLNQAAKGAVQAVQAVAGAGYGGFGNFLPAPTQAAAGAQWATAAAAGAQRLRMGIPIAQQAPPTARHWTMQDTLGAAAGQRVIDAEQRLAFLRSGPGMRATIDATRAETALARQQQYLGDVARLGRAGALLEAAGPGLQRLGMAGAAGLAASYGGIAGVSPEAGSQITNSFRMIANEIGIATIPAAVRFTGVLQSLSRGIRTVNESTGGWAGTLAFNAAALAAAAGGLYYAGRTAVQVAGGIGRAAQAGYGMVGFGGASAIAGAAVAAGAAYVTDESLRRQARIEGRTERGLLDYAARPWDTARGIFGMGPLGAELGPRFRTPEEIARNRIGAQREEARRAEIADVGERHPVGYGSALELYQALATQAQETPGAIAEQEQRAMVAWLQAIAGTLQTIQQQGAAGGTWAAPPAAENG